jgi:CRP-like cAMP-binding protein
MALLRPEARRTATVKALTPVEVMALGKENFYRLLDAIPALRLEFMGPMSERRRNEELRGGEESG